MAIKSFKMYELHFALATSSRQVVGQVTWPGRQTDRKIQITDIFFLHIHTEGCAMKCQLNAVLCYMKFHTKYYTRLILAKMVKCCVSVQCQL